MDQASATAATPIDASLLDKLFSNQLSEAETRRFVSGDSECTVFTLLALQQRIAASAQATGPNTPSAAIPPYAKESAKSPRHKKRKRGGQPGHVGRTRDPLPEPDRTREHQLESTSWLSSRGSIPMPIASPRGWQSTVANC